MKTGLTRESERDCSIVVRTYNEEDMIGRCLKAISDQQYEGEVEVVVVDSGSTDNTLKIVRSHDVNLLEITKNEFTYGGALNKGISETGSENIVLLSAHAIPCDNNWLAEIVKSLDVSDVAGVYGRQIPWEDCNPLESRTIMVSFKEESKQDKMVFSSANAAIKKSVWEKVKYDEMLPGSEDVYWAHIVGKMGYRLLYNPKAMVYHSHNEKLSQIYDRYHREAVGISEFKDLEYGLMNVFNYTVYNTVLDWLYILKGLRALRWFFMSPITRFTQALARYNAYRGR